MVNLVRLNRTVTETREMLEDMGRGAVASKMGPEEKMQVVTSASFNRPVYVTLKNGTAGDFYGEVVGERLKIETAPATFVLARIDDVAWAQMGA